MGEQETRLRITQLFEEIQGKEIREAALLFGDTGSWSRHRKMPLGDMLACTLAKKGLSTAMEVRHYFQAAGKAGQAVSKQDYLKQRQKLNPEAFRLLNRNCLRRFYGGGEPKGWRGYLVMAADGSRAEIPNSGENRRVYGESMNKYGKAVARANISGLHDAYNRFVLDIGAHHCRDSEIREAKEHIGPLQEIVGGRKTLIIFDRNYASLEFIDFLEKSGLFYLVRLHSTNYKAEVAQVPGHEGEVRIMHSKSRMEHLRRSMPERERELAQREWTGARVIKTRFANGEQGVLLTNLREGTPEEISRLYRQRWGIEKRFHALKNKLKLESVTGKASVYVKQDFWAQMLVHNIVQDLIGEAEKRAAGNARKKKLRYEVRVNENIAIGLFKEHFIKLVIEEDDGQKGALFKQLISDMERHVVPVRTLKSSPRKWKYFNKYKCNQKPSF
jgi:hypothetical protein